MKVSICVELSVHESAVAVPIVAIAVMQTARMRASITAYSTAVGPLSSVTNFATLDFRDWYMINWVFVDDVQYEIQTLKPNKLSKDGNQIILAAVAAV